MWRTVCYIVHNMENQVEECTKMIMSTVLVALKNNPKCLSLTCSGQTTLKAYFINTTCALCLWGGGEARSSLWARSVAQGRETSKERHMSYSILRAYITPEGGFGQRQRRHGPWVRDQWRKQNNCLMKGSTAWPSSFSLHFLPAS